MAYQENQHQPTMKELNDYYRRVWNMSFEDAGKYSVTIVDANGNEALVPMNQTHLLIGKGYHIKNCKEKRLQEDAISGKTSNYQPWHENTVPGGFQRR